MNDFRRPVGVKVSPHAVERFHERFPGERDYREIKNVIYREVMQGCLAGRIKSSVPRWVSQAGYKSHRNAPTRYVYNEQRTRCYAVMRNHERDEERADEYGVRWIVKTTLTSLDHEQQLEVQRLRTIDRANRGSGTNNARRGASALFNHKAGTR